MRRLFFAVVIAALGYSIYWFVGSRTVVSVATQTVEDLRADGWRIDYDSLRTRGFPSRFDTTVDDLVIAAPGNPVTYRLPFVQALALSYQPSRLIVIAPPSMTAEAEGAPPLIFANTGLRMSMTADDSAPLGIDHATAEAETLSIAVPDLSLRSGPMLAALRRSAAPADYDIYARLDTLSLPDGVWQVAFPTQALPQSAESVVVNAVVTVGQDAAGMPAVAALRLTDATLTWGDMTLAVAGELAPDAAGYASGSLTLTARNWAALVDGLAAAGLIPAGAAQMVRNAAQMMQGPEAALSVPLTFANGRIMMGFVPLGPAPRL